MFFGLANVINIQMKMDNGKWKIENGKRKTIRLNNLKKS